MLALQLPNGLRKDGTVPGQWRLRWMHPPIRVERDRLTGHTFSVKLQERSIAQHKIMAPCYRLLFMDIPVAQFSLSVDGLEGFKSRSSQVKVVKIKSGSSD